MHAFGAAMPCRHGTGHITFSNGDVYTGTVTNDDFLIIMSRFAMGRNKHVYAGTLNAVGDRHGSGVFYYTNGDVYTGAPAHGPQLERLRCKCRQHAPRRQCSQYHY